VITTTPVDRTAAFVQAALGQGDLPGPDALAGLRARIAGEVLTLADPGYDEARAGFNLLCDQRPAVIVVPATGADVAEALRFAAATRLRVSIHATGHGVARSADGALMIATRRLTDVGIDPLAKTARIAAGARWGAVLGPAQEHGLAPLLGSTTDVGAVGYTLGGGMGWLGRRYGLCSDSVRSFDLVTPARSGRT
jgi:FAD/FMN-containing dehydrogenase